MAFERSDKHGPRIDEAMAGETEAIERSGHTGRAEESREPEPEGDDQPQVDRAPNTLLAGGTPDGMSADDVEGRSELARFLRPSVFPANASALLDVARDDGATDFVLGELARLPKNRTFANTQEIWEALGHGVETHRN